MESPENKHRALEAIQNQDVVEMVEVEYLEE